MTSLVNSVKWILLHFQRSETNKEKLKTIIILHFHWIATVNVLQTWDHWSTRGRKETKGKGFSGETCEYINDFEVWSVKEKIWWEEERGQEKQDCKGC